MHGSCGSPGFLRHLHDRAHPWERTLDLRRMRFCEPLGLVALAAFAEGALLAGERVVVRGPTEPSIARYLSRMRLGAVLAGLGVEHDLPVVDEHDTGERLFELATFDGARGAGALAELVHRAVEADDLEAAGALYDGVCEAGQNVAHHSGRARGFLAAQRTHQGSRLLFAVADSGRGMLATLRGRGATSDADALKLALTPGLSGTPDQSRGVGLAEVLARVTSLHLLSGTASVTAAGRRRWYSTAERPFPGTVVQGEVRLPVDDRVLRLRDVVR